MEFVWQEEDVIQRKLEDEQVVGSLIMEDNILDTALEESREMMKKQDSLETGGVVRTRTQRSVSGGAGYEANNAKR